MSEPSTIDYERFLRGLEELLHEPPNSFQGGEVLGELDCWDSLAIVEFMAFADERYSITLAPKQITSCLTIHDLFAVLQAAAHEL
jgi:acyl carrier protein